MSHGLAVLIYRGGSSKVFLEPIPKGHSQFPDILLLTFHFGEFVPVDYHTLLNSGVLVLGATNRSMRKCYTYQHTYLPQMAPVLQNGAKCWGNRGELAPLWGGRIILTKVME